MEFPGVRPHEVFNAATQVRKQPMGPDGDGQRLPYILFPGEIGVLRAEANPGEDQSEGEPFLDIDLSVDGGEWPPELTYQPGDAVRVRICVNGIPVFRAFGLPTDIDATKEN